MFPGTDCLQDRLPIWDCGGVVLTKRKAALAGRPFDAVVKFGAKGKRGYCWVLAGATAGGGASEFQVSRT